MPPLDGLGTLVKSQLTIYMRIYFWDLNSIPLVYYVCLYASTTTVFDHYGFVVCSKSGNVKPPTSSFFKIVFGYLASFEIRYEF